jgi:AhpD family alkylhydroperoxidase
MKTAITKEQIYALSTESFGLVPGVIKEMAERSEPLAYTYLIGTQSMGKSSLTDLEINAIELKISSLNKCESCVKGHSFLVKKAGLSDADVKAILFNESTSIDRLNTLLKAAEYIYYAGNGIYADVVMDYFNDEELIEQVVFEIIGLIALKTISNYVNNYLASVKARARQVAH